MAAAALDRPVKSPSPLSFWTSVSPDHVTSPSRTVFTIVDDNAENSPRPPKPELSELEAKGMVSLSSQWTQEENKSTVANGSYLGRSKNQQEAVKRVKFSQNCDPETNLKPTSLKNNGVQGDYEDDLVIVTDKNTQTEQPWPYLGGPSSDKTHPINNISQHSTSNDDCVNNNIDSNNSEINSSSNTKSSMNQTSVDNSQCNSQSKDNGPLQTDHTTPDDPNASEAPTLKVEYVGKVWDAYINDFLLASDHISQAAIYDKASKSCIACSLQFAMSQEEFDHLLTSVNCLSVAYRQGISINCRQYKTVLADGRRGLMAKGPENDGCSVCQTRTLILIALHDRRSKGRRCNDELMRLGDFFWAKGL